MESYRGVRQGDGSPKRGLRVLGAQSLWLKMVLAVLLITGIRESASRAEQATANVTVWDTLSRFGDAVDLRDRAGWKAVPADLLTLEADPSKAFSDPGYYGREYSFAGDAVVENGCLTAVLWSGRGRVVVYSKAEAGTKVAEFAPRQGTTRPVGVSRCSILQNTGDEAALEVSFAAEGTRGDLSVVLSFDKTPIVEIRPAETVQGLSLLSPLEYGIVPDFIGDDLIFSPGQYPSADTLCVPPENLFLGLLPGEKSLLVLTWPKGRQQMTLRLGERGSQRRLIESLDFDNGGQSVYLAILEAPGIWHREELKPSYLEKDVAIEWRRPFPAKWVTQLEEVGVRTTFTFRESRGQIWRGVPGMYLYPVWFEGDSTCFRLGKKVPPKGESLIYFLEGKGTPVAVWTPVDIVKAALGRQACAALLDLEGRKLRTHHRRGAEGVRRACTCGGTEAIQAVFDAGQEVDKRPYVEGAVGDMVYFVRRHLERIDEYRRFADDVIEHLRAAGSSQGELKPFLDRLEQIARQIPQEYAGQRENLKSLEYAEELARRTIALTGKKSPANRANYADLSEKWRAMGGAQDGLLAQCHVITRRLSQEAGYGCVEQPRAAELAQEIRSRCRQCLRNPDGYEIWPDY